MGPIPDLLKEGPSHYLPCGWSYLVDLSDHCIHDLPFKGPENNGLVLNRIKDKASAWLDHTSTDIVDGSDGNYKAIPAEAEKLKGTVCGRASETICHGRASLVVQWLRSPLPIQGAQVQFLVREDSTHHRKAKPVCCNF